MKKRMISAILVVLAAAACLSAETAKVAGKWQMALDTPHGAMTAALEMKQDGTKVTGTCVTDHMGSLSLNGSLDADKLSFIIEMPDGPKLTFNGKVADNKITGTSDFGAWSATRQ